MFLEIILLSHLNQVSMDSENLCGVCRCSFGSRVLFCTSLNLTIIPLLHHEFEELHVVDISDNKLMTLDTHRLRNYQSSLRRFIASQNRIEDLPSTALHNMTSLVYLDLSWNSISCTLTQQQFSDVINLDYLSLSHNRIPCLEMMSFRKIPLLTELDLSYNKLRSQNFTNMTSCFSRDVICSLKNLIVLRISSNYLPEVFESDSFFSCLPNLTLLEASNCGIKTLSKNAFAGLHHVISLDLSDNSIVTWASEALRSTESLVYLDLGQNLLSELPEYFLRWCPDLTHLQLRNNRLRNWDYKWLEYFGRNAQQVSNLTKRKAVERVESHLSSSAVLLQVKTSSTAITKANRILYLDWSENLWICNCDIISFVGWLIEEGSWLTQVKGYRDVVCHEQRGYVFISRFVFKEGKIHRNTVVDLLRFCSNLSSSMTSRSQNVINTTVYVSTIFASAVPAVTSLQWNISSNETNSQELALLPHLAVIISVLVIVDAMAYIVIMLCIRKQSCCRKRNSVAP